MTNDELKKKIVSIVRGAMIEADELPFIETTDNIADALIAAGIGDTSDLEVRCEVLQRDVDNLTRTVEEGAEELKEAEHRAEVAERALDKAVKLFYEYRIESDVLSCSSCWIAEEAFKKCEAQGLYTGCPQRWKEEILIQAEKELAEEEKNDCRRN